MHLEDGALPAELLRRAPSRSTSTGGPLPAWIWRPGAGASWPCLRRWAVPRSSSSSAARSPSGPRSRPSLRELRAPGALRPRLGPPRDRPAHPARLGRRSGMSYDAARQQWQIPTRLNHLRTSLCAPAFVSGRPFKFDTRNIEPVPAAHQRAVAEALLAAVTSKPPRCSGRWKTAQTTSAWGRCWWFTRSTVRSEWSQSSGTFGLAPDASLEPYLPQSQWGRSDGLSSQEVPDSGMASRLSWAAVRKESIRKSLNPCAPRTWMRSVAASRTALVWSMRGL